MKNNQPDHDSLVAQLKQLVADLLSIEPDEIRTHEQLLGGGLAIDSLDAVDLCLCLEELFGFAINLDEEARRAFSSISSLAGFIHTRTRSGVALPRERERTRRTRQVLPYPAPA